MLSKGFACREVSIQTKMMLLIFLFRVSRTVVPKSIAHSAVFVEVGSSAAISCGAIKFIVHYVVKAYCYNII